MSGAILDILFLGLLGLMTLRGARRGALSTLVSLASYGLAYALAALVYNTSHLQLEQTYGKIGMYLVILPAVFIITVIIVRFAGRFITKALNLTLAGAVNKALGAALGFLKAGIVILALAAVIKFLTPVTGEWYLGSIVMSQIAPFFI